ncbi:lysylphosphatidylglycerol synthase transmembrane domain-containing protein [Conexibacter sp. DBS9H8]|uniref:lysylphosphatidylglycerol synthase transmembrane domain-containing protein n=1 Tax=Conexibacter sp. DBS9H8 TaxID=2937801 RepID=UPI00200E51D9|nr:lysylphosphatidylglycerol synthase transmembrane domain-containing protein [Conexibacter sp. DBS9H8]
MTSPAATDPDGTAGADGGFVAEEARATRNLLHGLISLGVLVALVVGLLLAVPGLHRVGHDVAKIDGGWIVIAVGLELLSCVGYIVAFLQVFDRAPVRFGARVAMSELAFGAAVSLGGAGSIAVGALLLVERGASPSHAAERSAVLFLLTSAINIITLAGIGLGLWIGLLPGDRDPLLSLLPGAVGVIVWCAFMALPRIVDRFIGDRAGRIAVALRATGETVRATERILFRWDWRILGAWIYLWADIFVLVICFWGVGVHPPLTTIVLAYQIGYLSNFVPIPGGVGILDGSFVGMFVLFGVKATRATAATVVYHGISLWVPAMWGTVAFLLLRRHHGQPLSLRPPRAERIAARRAARR